MSTAPLSLKRSIFITRVGSGGDISNRKYNLIMGLSLFWGFAFNFIVVYFFQDSIYNFLTSDFKFFFGFLGLYLAMVIAGTLISSRSSSAALSFLGYNMIVLPMGAVLSVILHSYSDFTIANAIVATGLITVLMIVLSVSFPQFFLKIGRSLFVSLFAVVILDLVTIFIFRVNLTIIDIAVGLIFCGYIGFDWARAQRIPYTVKNAIDCSCALYLDIINLFIRILRVMGKKK